MGGPIYQRSFCGRQALLGVCIWDNLYRSTSNFCSQKAECGIYNLNSTDITFSEISEQWLYSVRQGVKESTFSHYQYTLRHYLQPVFGDFKVSALSEKILEQGLLAVITPANGKQKTLGATMAQECLSMLRRICKYAAHFHLIRPFEIMVKLPQNPTKYRCRLLQKNKRNCRRL